MSKANEMRARSDKRRQPTKNSFDKIVQIKVGPEEEVFQMHRQLLYGVAPYFEAELEDDFREGKDLIIEMPEEDPKIFKLFQLWAYTGAFLAEDETNDQLHWDVLFGLYFFGHVYCIAPLQNEVIDALLVKVLAEQVVPTSYLRVVYGSTPESSQLRRLLVDITSSVESAKVKELLTRVDRSSFYPADFVFELAIALSDQRLRGAHIDIYQLKSSDYHVRSAGSPSEDPNGEFKEPQ